MKPVFDTLFSFSTTSPPLFLLSYFLCAVPMNLMMNHLGRTIGGEVL